MCLLKLSTAQGRKGHLRLAIWEPEAPPSLCLLVPVGPISWSCHVRMAEEFLLATWPG